MVSRNEIFTVIKKKKQINYINLSKRHETLCDYRDWKFYEPKTIMQ